MSIDVPARADALSVAAADAAAAAGAAGVEVRLATSMVGAEQAAGLFDTVWGAEAVKTPSELLRAMAFAGNYVATAHNAEGDVVGASVGFWDAPAHGSLHSHITGVVPDYPGAGYALKLHQRQWVMSKGGRRIGWTFDALVRRNAYFNLAKLGARVVDYQIDFYGDMPDAFNKGDETDRCVIEWDLYAPIGRSLDIADVEARGGARLLEVGPDGGPRAVTAGGDGPLLVQVPPDVTALRRDQPELARAWRYAVRETLGSAVRQGSQVVGATRDGWLVIERGGA